MIDQETLQAISAMMDEKLSPIKEDIHELKTDVAQLKEDMADVRERLEIVEENTEITRGVANLLLPWAERVAVVTGIPLYEKAE